MIGTRTLRAIERATGDISCQRPVDVPEEDLVALLEAGDPEEADLIARTAARVRDLHCGARMTVRALVEFSSHCRNTCRYCGLNRDNARAERFRLGTKEVLECARLAHEAGVRTVVLQSGEDGAAADGIARLVEAIKDRYDMAVTLSVGERPREDYALWRSAGADRYLLRIEATDEGLYRALHRGREVSTRFRCLEALRELGYQVGSGIMTGLPGQTSAHLARDIRFLASREFDMIGVGPFIPHPDTPLRDERPGGADLAIRVVALLRIVTRNAWLPATTALGSLDRDYRADALRAGANVLMPNFTPAAVKRKYAIYPGKRCVTEGTGACSGCIEGIAASAGLVIDYSRADTLKASAVSSTPAIA